MIKRRAATFEQIVLYEHSRAGTRSNGLIGANFARHLYAASIASDKQFNGGHPGPARLLNIH
jgi:hypothetical protein